ncbi:MAG: hypothetical protein IPG23_11510 [Burkholderiales bacterium]|nr:hypothetical protein [Burkholderiales bacterium]
MRAKTANPTPAQAAQIALVLKVPGDASAGGKHDGLVQVAGEDNVGCGGVHAPWNGNAEEHHPRAQQQERLSASISDHGHSCLAKAADQSDKEYGAHQFGMPDKGGQAIFKIGLRPYQTGCKHHKKRQNDSRCPEHIRRIFVNVRPGTTQQENQAIDEQQRL